MAEQSAGVQPDYFKTFIVPEIHKYKNVKSTIQKYRYANVRQQQNIGHSAAGLF